MTFFRSTFYMKSPNISYFLLSLKGTTTGYHVWKNLKLSTHKNAFIFCNKFVNMLNALPKLFFHTIHKWMTFKKIFGLSKLIKFVSKQYHYAKMGLSKSFWLFLHEKKICFPHLCKCFWVMVEMEKWKTDYFKVNIF